MYSKPCGFRIRRRTFDLAHARAASREAPSFRRAWLAWYSAFSVRTESTSRRVAVRGVAERRRRRPAGGRAGRGEVASPVARRGGSRLWSFASLSMCCRWSIRSFYSTRTSLGTLGGSPESHGHYASYQSSCDPSSNCPSCPRSVPGFPELPTCCMDFLRRQFRLLP